MAVVGSSATAAAIIRLTLRAAPAGPPTGSFAPSPNGYRLLNQAHFSVRLNLRQVNASQLINFHDLYMDLITDVYDIRYVRHAVRCQL
jgi:hypothetical protein